MKRKAQAWGFDLVVGMILFLAGIVSLYVYTANLPGAGEEVFYELQQDAELVADSLMSEGSPVNWDQSDVIRIGILTDDRVDSAKLNNFSELASSNYQYTKSLFRITHDYYVYFEGDFAGGIGNNPTGATNLVRVARVVVYDQNITTLNVHAWN